MAAYKTLAFVCFLLAAASGGEPTDAAADAPSARPLRVADLPAFVISLERTPLRWALFTAASSAFAELPRLVRLPATDGQKLAIARDARVAPAGRVGVLRAARRSHAGLATRGMVGLYVSHVAAWRALLASGAPAGVVLEDDALVRPGTGAALDALLAGLPTPAAAAEEGGGAARASGGAAAGAGGGAGGAGAGAGGGGDATWDVFLLGVVAILEQRPAPRALPPGWSRVTNWFGTQAYLVTRAGARRLLARAYPMTSQIDAYMAQMAAAGELSVLARPAREVDVPQFGLPASTTVQQAYCNTCDLPIDWARAGDGAAWMYRGVGLGAAAGAVPWGAWARAAAAAAAALEAARRRCARGGGGGGATAARAAAAAAARRPRAGEAGAGETPAPRRRATRRRSGSVLTSR